MVDRHRERFAFYGHGAPERATVGLGGQIFAAKSQAEAIEHYTPYLRNTYVYQGAGLEEVATRTLLAVGTPERIVAKYLA